jgi:hypothetical protein
MGPIAITIVVCAAVLGLFLALMAWRGLLDDLSVTHALRCEECQRLPRVPLPASHRCWRCRHQHVAHVPIHMTAHPRG